MNVDTSDWIVLAGGVVFSLGALLSLPRQWRGNQYRQDPPSWWLWGRSLWRGWVRTGPVASLAFVLMFGAIFMALAAGSISGPIGDAVNFVALLPIVGFCVSGIFCLTIILFNRPRFAVPPPYRSELGVVSTWLMRLAPRKR